MNVGVTGATGRMGRTVLDVLDDRNVAVAFAVSRSGPANGPADQSIESADGFGDLLAAHDVDVVVDFSAPAASVGYAEAAADAGVPIVVGTTGFADEEIQALESAGERTPVLVGANFARGVQALISAVETAVASLPKYDVELTETHHNGKRDAPSGTANVILDRIDAARGTEATRVHGREGEAPRSDDEIGVHARRAGDVTGEHEVLLAGNRETVSLSHRAGSRAVFAAGAVDAAAWLTEQEPNYYRFSDIADELT
ncbi:4-hydroxy-tetrahydrodipicolinate reductase [Halanaeroarchaeum sulfurireducens]|uniref:4-hydroxy-tetrahydrodipicolinate reductase n=1 Tax=Halanaeroarchaeum sulfurireducens TaxID=1604004 RepID=A0A0F7PD18_9EURY|nr:4-hydroxy-tetrahydrodipicolinate reductase [Halanaeroarchaeum sulfurireducens]AKH97213.1 dihydrodipicolinate reductase [Halanaeroarchaeum sulfurireducens]ALG81615.1 dihydrodipicolinate reductase [Halanaeroarchaeum sulfurireducens]